MSYRVLIAGLGNIGIGYDLGCEDRGRVASLARAFSLHPKFKLVGGVDLASLRRGLFEQHYECPSFASLEMAMEEVDPDVVAIAAPTELHYSVFSEVMRLKVPQAILCEKPLSFELHEAIDMVHVAQDMGVQLFTNYMRRCDPSITEIHRRIKSDEIIGPLKGVCWYSKGLFNNGSHFLNLCQYLMGNVVDIQIINSGRLWNGLDPEPDVKIAFDAGVVYFLAAQEENFSHCTLELVADNGRMRYEHGIMLWQPAVKDSANVNYTVLDSTGELMEANAPRLQWFVADQISLALSGEQTSICTGSQGLETIQILTQIKKRL